MRIARLLLRQRRPVTRIHAVRREDDRFVSTVCGVLSGIVHAALSEGEPDCPDCLRKLAPKREPSRSRPEVAARIEERAAYVRSRVYADGRAAWVAGLPWNASPATGRRAWEDGWMDAAMDQLRAVKREAAGVV